jgi:hypothetical protein
LKLNWIGCDVLVVVVWIPLAFIGGFIPMCQLSNVNRAIPCMTSSLIQICKFSFILQLVSEVCIHEFYSAKLSQASLNLSFNLFKWPNPLVFPCFFYWLPFQLVRVCVDLFTSQKYTINLPICQQ